MPGVVEQFVEHQHSITQELEAARALREQRIEELANLTLHPEMAQQNDWKSYGDLARTDQQIERLALADDLHRYAQQYPGQAEEALGNKLADAIYQGNQSVNLSQEYLTDDPNTAAHRHSWALVNLDDYIDRAEKLGVTVDLGDARTYGRANTFEESQGFSQGVS